MNFIEKLGYGGITTVIGLIIVFSGLIIIVLCLYLMSSVFKSIDRKKAEKAAQPAPAVPEPEEAPAPEAEAPSEETNDDELIAVLAAAVAAFCAQSGTQDVRIKSVRRVSSWKNVARSEQILKL